MNYQNIYNSLINKGIKRNLYSKRYKIGSIGNNHNTEVHHILPRCLGGSDDKSNLVVLTMREHYIAHMLLCKIFPNNSKLSNAFIIMKNRTNGKKSKLYETLKNAHVNYLKNKMNSEDFWTDEKRESRRIKGLELSKNPEYLKKVSNGVKMAYKNNPMLKDIISKKSKELWQNESFRMNQLNKMTLRWQNKNECEKMSQIIKTQNKNNPEIKKKRVDAIKNHMYNKSQEWIRKQTIDIKIRMNLPETKKLLSERYRNSKFDNSRKVINLLTNEIYVSGIEAAKAVNLKYVTVKKWLNINNGKHNLKWLDLYERDNGKNDL